MITSIEDCTRLNNGLDMPWLGLGVYLTKDGEEVEQAVRTALELGYRSIDTAAIYDNEAGVGKGMRDSGVAREQVFLTTKVWNDEQRNKRTVAAFEESLARLKTDYVDLYLIHWPVEGCYLETWKAMEEIYRSGRAKAIGVSNFMQHHLEDIMRESEIVPAVNQMEFHPTLVQPELLSFCQNQKIQFEAWSPLMQGRISNVSEIVTLANKYNKSPAQITLRWNLQHKVVTIPKSVHANRISENAQIFDFELSETDMKILNALDQGHRLGPDPDSFNF